MTSGASGPGNPPIADRLLEPDAGRRDDRDAAAPEPRDRSDWTPRAIERAKTWVGRHAHVFAVRGLTALGVLLIIKGIGLVS